MCSKVRKIKIKIEFLYLVGWWAGVSGMRGVVYLTDRLGVKDARTASVGEEVHVE